eukprot:1628953-Rhodomonas_salina.1
MQKQRANRSTINGKKAQQQQRINDEGTHVAATNRISVSSSRGISTFSGACVRGGGAGGQ